MRGFTMGNDNEIKKQEHDAEHISKNNPDAHVPSSPKKLRWIKGINGDFTIVDEHGNIVGIGMGF